MKFSLLHSAAAVALITSVTFSTAYSAPKIIQLAQATTEAPANETRAQKRARIIKERKAARQAERAKKIEERKAARQAEREKKIEERKAARKAANKAKKDATKRERQNTQNDEGAPAPQPQPTRQNEDPERPVDTRAASQSTDDGVDPTRTAPAVVRDNLTREQRANLRAAERERRRERRKNRKKLLGAFAAGAVVGTVVNELGGRVVEDEGDRIVVERNGRYYVRKDENDLFRRGNARVTDEVLPNGDLRTVVARPGDVNIVTVRDPAGNIVRRVRVSPNGNRVTLIDNPPRQPERVADFRAELGALRLDIARDRYIVEAERADRQAIRTALAAEPVERVERQYTLNEVRQNSRLRDKMRRVDLNSITFATGEFALNRSQVSRLADVADAIENVISKNPNEIFLVEGHTDAVGSEISNLTLSDRRADAVAQILTTRFNLPPENFVVQGYGETNLKVETEADERRNRRVTVRRITPLIRKAGG